MLVLVARTAYEAVGVAGTTGPAGYSDSVENEESKRARQAHAGTASGLFRVEPILVPRPRAVQDGLWMHASDSVAIAHVLLTRFCLRHGSMSHLVAARLSLFRGLSIPTVKSQTASRILWIVLIDETLQADAVQVSDRPPLPHRVKHTTRGYESSVPGSVRASKGNQPGSSLRSSLPRNHGRRGGVFSQRRLENK
jgi:hypothetical protein